MRRLNCRQGENDIRSLFKSDFRGKAGIGTSTPGYKPEVNGAVRSKMVAVEATGWPDYVFQPGYELASLAEIEAFIKANKHLPEIPSAAEMEEEGIVLGEMNMLLLKKIEELTLYAIAQEKALEEEKAKSTEAIKELLKRIEHLEQEKGW